mgnify:CR=1 FL=1
MQLYLYHTALSREILNIFQTIYGLVSLHSFKQAVVFKDRECRLELVGADGVLVIFLGDNDPVTFIVLIVILGQFVFADIHQFPIVLIPAEIDIRCFFDGMPYPRQPFPA